MQSKNNQKLWEDPAAYFANSYTAAHSLGGNQLEALQLEGLRQRFAELRENVPALNVLARAQGITSIDSFNEVIPLLFLHSVYKSYRQESLKTNEFGVLNQWLNKLTSHDLLGVRLEKTNRIDGWINALADQSEVMPWVSSGTSGTMTFMPHSKAEMDRFARTYPMTLLQDYGDDPEEASSTDIHEIWPFYRRPGGGMNLDFDLRIKYMLGGDEGRFHPMYPATNSLDIRYLQTQMRLAKLEEWDQMAFSPELIEENKRFEREQADMPNKLDGFLGQCSEVLKGKRIMMLGTWPLMYQMAKTGLAAGKESVFAPNSRILAGGGRKGTVLPDNWRDDVLRFTGAEKLGGLYGMTEVLARHTQCAQGHIHLQPWVITLLLDPETSRPLPREGRQTGRYAFYDLLADSHWGGLISGDRVTVDWEGTCSCGASSAYIVDGEIGRYADFRGGTDKIVPPGKDSAHSTVMNFLGDIAR